MRLKALKGRKREMMGDDKESFEKEESVPAVHVRHHIDLGLRCCNLLLGRELGATAKEERHLACVVGCL